MTRILFPFFAAVIAFFSNSEPAEAKKLVALVIGINKYDNLPEKKQLLTAINDADAVRSALTELEFDVEPALHDATYAEIVGHWSQLLEAVGTDGIALFYFAGHGIQSQGMNFLAPRNAILQVTDPQSPGNNMINFRRLLDELGKVQKKAEDANGAGITGIFILDACRNVSDLNFSEDKNEGLAPIRELPRQVFVMYSAGIGQTALDRKPGVLPENAVNSVYTTELLPLLRKQLNGDVPLAELAQVLRFKVYQEARKPVPGKKPHHQTPAYYDQLITRQTILGKATDPVRVAVAGVGDIVSADETRSMGDGDILKECLNCPEMVRLPARDFAMGEAGSDGGQIKVAIKEPFFIGRFEVTKGEWNACVKDTLDRKLTNAGCTVRRDVSDDKGRDRQPVSDVTWQEAMRYTDWLSGTIDRTNASASATKRYRLPTEAEWEYSARGVPTEKQTAYSFGDNPAQLCDYANGAGPNIKSLFWVNWKCERVVGNGLESADDGTGREAAQTGSYKPNTWGLFDVHGNVAEWVSDCWQPVLGKQVSAQESTACSRRVVRGGSWRSDPSALRSAARNAVPPSVARPTIGFRVVREIEK